MDWAKWLPWRKEDEIRSIPVQTDRGLLDLSWGQISEELALSYAPVWQAVKIISGDCSNLPLCIEGRNEDGAWEKNRTHPLNALLRSPDWEGYRGPTKFWRRVLVELLLWENAYCVIHDAGLELLNSQNIYLDRTTSGELMYVYTGQSGPVRAYFPDELLHFEGIYLDRDDQTNPPFPVALMRQMLRTVSQGKNSEEYMESFFRHGGRLGGILELPIGTTKKARERIEEGWVKHYERPDAAFKTAILREGVKFHTSQAKPADAEMTAARDQIAGDVARWFNLPPHLLGLERQSSYNSLSEENRRYLNQTLDYWLQAITDELGTKLLSARQRQEWRFRHDTTELTRGTMGELVAWGDTAIQGKMITRNEWRQIAGFSPVDGGDEFETTRAENQDNASEMGESEINRDSSAGNEGGETQQD